MAVINSLALLLYSPPKPEGLIALPLHCDILSVYSNPNLYSSLILEITQADFYIKYIYSYVFDINCTVGLAQSSFICNIIYSNSDFFMGYTVDIYSNQWSLSLAKNLLYHSKFFDIGFFIDLNSHEFNIATNFIYSNLKGLDMECKVHLTRHI